ncbi:MAG: hypothetical protein QOG87_3673 [Actinomycetota bacterium]
MRRIEVAADGDVAEARVSVRAAMAGRSEESITAAELIISELVTNGLLHGGGIESVVVTGTADGARIEVADRNSRSPLMAVTSSDAMTGRGLHLVTRLASGWGVTPTATGKVVWADVVDAPSPATPESEEELLAIWDDPFEDGPSARVHITLGQVPTELLVAAKRHVDNIVREFTLAASGGRSGVSAPVPASLAGLIDRVVHRFEDARLIMKRQATEAARAGASHVVLELGLPVEVADAAEEYLQALDEVDSYCRANRLLTLETPPQHRLFRRWYIGEIVKQLRAVANGDERPPVRAFEQCLLGEIDRADRARRTAEQAARLYTVAVALASAVSAEDVAAAVLQEGVAALGASGGGVILATGANRLSVPGTVGYDEPVVTRLREEHPDADLPAAHALRTGEAVWLETVEERDARFPALAGLEPGTVAMCAIPLITSDGVLGALRFSFTERTLFDDDEQRFVLALAAEAAEALQRANLLHLEREARRRLEHERASLEKLAAVGEAMMRRRDLDAILQVATDAATQVTGAEFGAFFYNAEDQTGQSYLLYSLSGAPREAFADFPMPRATAVFGATFAGTGNVRFDDVTTEAVYGHNPPHHGMPDGHLPVRSYMAIPVLLSSGDVVGGLFFGHSEVGRFGASEERLAVGVAGQTAAAIEIVRSLEDRARVAAQLQQSLLPAELPAVPGAELGAAYSAAGAAVGGDFYDVFPISPGRWGVVIGDVRGRGPQAAALTALTRYTIRTAALLGRGPAETLAVLNRALLANGDAEQFCTSVVAVLEIGATGARVTYASGGHPPVAVLRRDAIELLPPTGPLLGMFEEAEFSERVVDVGCGDSIVLYTDGISEARCDGEEFGDGRMQQTLAGLRGCTAAAIADGLISEARTFGVGVASDDAAVFAVKIDE